MDRRLRTLLCGIGWLAATSAPALQLAYEPVALGWTAQEVDQATLAQHQAIVERADAAGLRGCLRHCERLRAIFARLTAAAREQSPVAAALPWTLTVVRLDDVDALALPGGRVLVSEAFIDARALTDEALAFVLGHEMAHIVLEHERQALTFARMLLPREVQRSVRDVYTELDHNFALLRAMEPVLQQGEFEADELGLLLASRCGFAPAGQLAFVEDEARRPPPRQALLATHPDGAARLARLRAVAPLAQRLVPLP